MAVFHSAIRRRGVSLLEVLVSIGVTSVGLLGVLSLIPLGAGQARQGQVYERAPIIYASAMSEVRARDMLAPSNWRTTTFNSITLTNVPFNSFCIDPLTVNTDLSTGNVVGSPAFPTNAVAKMDRLSLWSGLPAGQPQVMPQPMANAIFRSHDDLRIADLQVDKSLPPLSVWDRTSDPTAKAYAGAATRRQDEGTMSWMMTVSPNLARMQPYDLYTVSIVVFHRRVIDPALANEFTLNVTSFPGGGVSGGDIVVDTSGLSATDLREAKTPENSWALLSGQVTLPQGSGTINVFQWYRVLGSEQDTNQRNITLAGPDWPVNNAALPLTNSQLTIIPGTIAVYQKNMQIEGTSLWRK